MSAILVYWISGNNWVSDYNEKYTVIYYSLESICSLSVTIFVLYFGDEDVVVLFLVYLNMWYGEEVYACSCVCIHT